MSGFGSEGAIPEWAQDDDGTELTSIGESGEPLEGGEAVTNLDTGETAGQEAPEATTPATPENIPEAEQPTDPAAQTAPSPVSSTPEASQPGAETPAATDQPAVDWQKRYGDLFSHQGEIREQSRELAERNQRLEAAMQKVIPVLQQMQSRARQPSDDELTKLNIDPESYRAMKPLVDQEMDIRTRQMREEMAQADERRAFSEERTAIAANANRLMAEKGIERGSDLDGKIGTFLEQLHYASQQMGLGQIDLRDSSLFDLAYEAAQSDSLRQIFLANPHWIDDDSTVALARRQAAFFDSTQPAATTQPGAVSASPATPASEPLPHVATGGSGGNPSGGSPREWDPLGDAKELVKNERGSVFG